MKKRKDKLSEAVAQLKQESLSQGLPKEVLDETLRRMADRGLRIADSRERVQPIRSSRSAIHHLFRLAAAAAVLVLCGYITGRLATPKPVDLDQLREALTPSVAAAIELAIRTKLANEMRRDYQVALAGMYLRVKEELTEQYRSDLNRFALQTLAASNAVTNELLTQLVQSIDTAQTQDLRRIARALYEIEMNRVQDKTQLASGLQTLAYRTEDELSRTQDAIVQLAADTRPTGFDLPPVEPRQTYKERNKP
jgi:hypothetical protein